VFSRDAADFGKNDFLSKSIEFLVIQAHVMKALEIASCSQLIQEIVYWSFKKAVEALVELWRLRKTWPVRSCIRSDARPSMLTAQGFPTPARRLLVTSCKIRKS
jgi:hypothetical protein